MKQDLEGLTNEERETRVNLDEIYAQRKRQIEEEGRRAGLQEGHRLALLKLLSMRFGDLPDAVVARIHAAGTEQLDGWISRALAAGSLGEVLGEE